MEAVLCQLLQHLYGVFETVLGKLVVALPVGAKPARIKMYHIGRDAVGSQLTGYLQPLFL